MAVGLVIYSKAIAFEAKSSRPRQRIPRPRNLSLRPRINIPVFYVAEGLG